MDEEKERGENLIGLPETIFILMLVGVEEIMEIAILLFTAGLGIIVVEVMNGAMAGLIESYIVFRGGKGILKLVVQPICAVIDGLTGGLLPGKFIGTAAAIWVINHPEIIDKAVAVIAKVGGQAITAAAAVATGGAGGVAAKVVGGKAVAVAEKKVVEVSASAARSRMATATGGTSGKFAQVNRIAQRREQIRQRTQQKSPQEEIPLKEAA